MARPVRSALVLQGGGALGAYELGAARALYADKDFAPDVIAGVSIGAVTAALLARPAQGLRPLEALEAFWQKVTVPAPFVPPPFRQYASLLGNRDFFTLRQDYFNWPNWTYLYETAPLRETLRQLVDLDALADGSAAPQLLVSAIDLKEGQIKYFYSGDPGHRLTLDHIMASGSVPPAFPRTVVDNRSYWDGGLFDNTPLGAVIDRLDRSQEVDRVIYVVNLFQNKAPIPVNLLEVIGRMKNLQFANKTYEDVKLLRRFNEVAELTAALEQLPGGNPLAGTKAYDNVKRHGYVPVPFIVAIGPPENVDVFSDADFSPETIKARADEGYACAIKALAECDAHGTDTGRRSG